MPTAIIISLVQTFSILNFGSMAWFFKFSMGLPAYNKGLSKHHWGCLLCETIWLLPQGSACRIGMAVCDVEWTDKLFSPGIGCDLLKGSTLNILSAVIIKFV
ncbi:MAG: hypothetical protein J3R72DRAFT_61795 [Linnemannia gamsii]|nr:MAG: hypothetical protein J3R72DRAFT_61795 [Linnemannia gamsii]